MRLSLTLCALLACLLCLETGASLAQSSDWSNLIEYGRQALDKGNFDGAETALRSAISGAESEHVSALRYIEAYELLGDVYLRKRDYKRAEEQYLYALEVTKDKPDDPATAFTLQQLASVYAHQNLYLQAEPYLRRALRVWEKEGRKYDADRLRCLESLTLVCDSQGKLLDGERFHKAAHALSDKLTRRAGKAAQPVARKPLDPNSAAAIYERAIARIKQGDKAGYEASLREALAAADAEGADGANRKLKDRVLNSLAQLLTDQHKYDEAAALRLKAVELIENAEGANASSLVHPLTSLGSLYIKSGKIAPAESVLTRALAIVYGREGAQPMDATLTLFALGDLYKKKEDLAAEESLYKKARERFKDALATDPDLYLSQLGYVYYQQERYDDALAAYRQVLATEEKEVGATSAMATSTMYFIAAALSKQGKHAEAEPYFKRCVETRRRVTSEVTQIYHNRDSTLLCLDLQNLGDCYLHQDKFAEAEECYRELLKLDRQEIGRGSAAVAKDLSNLGLLYQKRNEPAHALEFFKDAWQAYRQDKKAMAKDLAQYTRDYASALRQVGRAEEADSLEAQYANPKEPAGDGESTQQ